MEVQKMQSCHYGDEGQDWVGVFAALRPAS